MIIYKYIETIKILKQSSMHMLKGNNSKIYERSTNENEQFNFWIKRMNYFKIWNIFICNLSIYCPYTWRRISDNWLSKHRAQAHALLKSHTIQFARCGYIGRWAVMRRFSSLYIRQLCLLTNPSRWKCASSVKIIFRAKLSCRLRFSNAQPANSRRCKWSSRNICCRSWTL